MSSWCTTCAPQVAVASGSNRAVVATADGSQLGLVELSSQITTPEIIQAAGWSVYVWLDDTTVLSLGENQVENPASVRHEDLDLTVLPVTAELAWPGVLTEQTISTWVTQRVVGSELIALTGRSVERMYPRGNGVSSRLALEGVPKQPWSGAIDSKGIRGAIVGVEGVRVYDLATGEMVARLDGNYGRVAFVGDTLLATDGHQALFVSEYGAGKVRATTDIPAFAGDVPQVAGDLVVFPGFGRTVLYLAEEHILLADVELPSGSQGLEHSSGVTPDGRWLLVLSADRSNTDLAHFFATDLDIATLLESVCRAAGSGLTEENWGNLSGDEEAPAACPK